MKKSEIRFSIALDDNKVPEAISWSATDAGPDIHFAKAINIALWDREQAGTMKIDLWTKDMEVFEMKRFYIELMSGIADTLLTATNDSVMADAIEGVCETLSKKLDEEMKAAK